MASRLKVECYLLLTERILPSSEDVDAFVQKITQKKVSQTLEHFKKQVVYFEDTIEFIQRIPEGNLFLKGIGSIAEKPILAMATWH